MSTPKKKDKKRGNGKKKKNKYRVRNWKEYNESLVNRGRIMFWISDETIEKWEETEKPKGRGRPKKWSDTAIETGLVVGQVFHQPLRQAEGLLKSIFEKLKINQTVPDYSTLSVRSKTLQVTIRVRPVQSETIHLIVDSTGIKIFGEGEWKVRMHGWCKHRRWKKLHVGVDEKTGDILLGEVTGNNIADSEAFPLLLKQLPEEISLSQVSADGGYDRRKCYQELTHLGVPVIAVPPQENAKIFFHGNRKATPHPRDENLRKIRKVGRKKWKEQNNYHRRSLVETTMFRLKTVFTDRISARTESSQKTQLLLRCKALNQMTTFGMPESYLVR